MNWTASLLCVCMALTSGALHAAPSISFDGPNVEAVGLSPGGKAIFFSLDRKPQGYVTKIGRAREVAEAGEDGVAALELAADVPVRSIWAVVDLTSGELAIAGPEDSPLLLLDLPPGALPADSEGRRDRLVDRREGVDLLVVRPGIGAWAGTVRDGGEKDLDAADDGWLAVGWAGLEPVVGEPRPPDEVVDGDICE